MSQVLPGAGGVFQGHLAMAVVAIRDPKLLPSRRGFILTLNIVPAGNVAAVIPCCAIATANREFKSLIRAVPAVGNFCEIELRPLVPETISNEKANLLNGRQKALQPSSRLLKNREL